MSRRAASWLAWSLCAFSLALTALSLLLLIRSRSHPNVHVFDYWVENTMVRWSSRRSALWWPPAVPTTL